MDPAITASYRNIPNANSLRNQDIHIINSNLKLLLPPLSSSFSEEGRKIKGRTTVVMNKSMSSSSSESALFTSKSILSVDAPPFVPRSNYSKIVKSPSPPPLSTSIVLPCYGADCKVYNYIWKIDENHKLIPQINVKIPPPKFVEKLNFSVILPTQIDFKMARGALLIDEFNEKLNLDSAAKQFKFKVIEEDEIQCDLLDDNFHRYERHHLLNLMSLTSSLSEPNLSGKVDKIIGNKDSQTFLSDTIGYGSGSGNVTNKSFDASSNLRKSVSFASPLESFADDYIIYRKFLSSLNKLTDENFESILLEVKNFKNVNDKNVHEFIKILYSKAIKEPLFASHYVKFTMALKDIFVVEDEKCKSFKELAIVACKNGHEEAKKNLKRICEFNQDQRDTIRYGLVGSMKFLTKMFENDILSRDFIVKICEELLEFECDESIEPLCKLLEFISNKLECDGKIKSIFHRIDEIQAKFPTRIRFMIQNLLKIHRDSFEVSSTTNKRDKIEMKSQNPKIHRKSTWQSRTRKSSQKRFS